jgi:hypothetical protein
MAASVFRQSISRFAKRHGRSMSFPLSAPDRPIVAVSGAVERHADDAAIEGAALRQHARDVGAMVLD